MGFSGSGRAVEEDTFGKVVERDRKTEIFELLLNFVGVVLEAEGKLVGTEVFAELSNLLFRKMLVGKITEVPAKL